ncbi:MAG: hypothetical protein OXI55_08000, partial [Gammaproteobacteria bacterium]|nr:hypothetical protein [Gammaproteobacteria bacterium]
MQTFAPRPADASHQKTQLPTRPRGRASAPVGAGLVPARVEGIDELEPGRDKPVPYEEWVEAQQFAQANCQRARQGA